MIKPCRLCSRAFEARGNQRICDDAHGHHCNGCGVAFILEDRYPGAKGYLLTNRERLYCSDGCADEAKRAATARAKARLALRDCSKCGTAFEGNAFRRVCTSCEKSCKQCGGVVGEAVGTLCSQACYDSFHNEANAKRAATREERGSSMGLGSPEARAKAAATNLERFGAANAFASEEVRSRIAETNRGRYGVANPVENAEVRARIAATKLERYGSETFNNSEKAMATNLERYGVTSPSMCEDLILGVEGTQKKVADAELEAFIDQWLLSHGRRITLTELQEHYGYASPVTLGKRVRELGIQEKVGVRSSYLEALVAAMLDSHGITYKRRDRTVIKPQELDFFLPEYNVAIEVNDFLTHNSTWSPWGPPKPKDFHLKKTLACRGKGVRLIHAWEHYLRDGVKFKVLENAILHACGLTKHRVAARKLKVVECEPHTLKDFFEANNIAGYRGGTTAFALVDGEGKVFMAYVLGKPLFGRSGVKKYDAELVRGASLLGHVIPGGAQRLWKAVVARTSFDSIVYYVDLNVYAGQSVAAIEGFSKGAERVSFKNYFVASKVLKNRNPRLHGEIVAAVEAGEVWTIFDAGVQVNVWTRPASIS